MGIQATHTVTPVAETSAGSPFRRNSESKEKPGAKTAPRDLDPDEKKGERKGKRRRGLDIRA